MPSQYYVYILTNKWHTVLYTGITSNLAARLERHQEKAVAGFTRRYNVSKLVHCETFTDVRDAIGREKQIKSMSRIKKAALVNSDNPEWRDLFESA